ncbi:hypothetical protein FJT64_022013 [Amphibalanus amphitrite]|uniref:Uncharacterized protein n=1 Tax=Amphibalanus amphitrite TaxID=1232801 RepID=A0A6A4WRT9_AMPAM|nr:hypothetical protein FJT64_022013 [Amphibalanus amphitrite]
MMVKARDAFHEVMLDEMKAFVEKQPCVSVVADKVTLNKRTVDITAINLVVPTAPPGEMLVNFVVAAPVVKEHDGTGMAGELSRSLARVGVTCPEQVAAFGGDGQFHHMDVARKLSVSLSQEPYNNFEIPAIWDPSHLMNLAEKDARKRHAWVDDTIEQMSRVSKHFSYGAGHEALLEAGPENERFPSLKTWSETRFAAHAADTFRSFLKNVDRMREALRRKLLSARGTRASELYEDVRLMKDGDFLARIAALCDIYALLGSGSRDQQKTQQLPWESSAAFGSTLLTLETMAEAMVCMRKPPSSQVEMAIRNANFDEAWPETTTRKHEVLGQTELISSFCEELLETMKRRRRGMTLSGPIRVKNQTVTSLMWKIRKVGDLVMVQASKDTQQLQVRGICEAMELLVAQGLIPASSVAPESSVVEAVSVLRTLPSTDATNQHLLRHLHREQERKPLLRAYVQLVTRLWLLLPAESVVESMASVLKEVFATHRQLHHDNAAKELVVRWNGPDVGEADQLISRVQSRFKFCVRRKAMNPKQMLSAVLNTHLVKKKRWSFFGTAHRSHHH